MPRSEYISELRAHVGSRLLVLPGVTAVIVDERGRFLLAKHIDSGLWGLVGGAIEPLEQPRDALVREIREELGADAEIVGVLDSYGGPDLETTYPNGDRVSYVTTAYFVRLLSKPRAAEPEEIMDVGWFDLDEIAELPLGKPEWVRSVIADANRKLAS